MQPTKRGCWTRDMMVYALCYINGRMLDLGAGRGKYSSLYRKKASEYIACDIVAAPNIDFVEDAEHLSFPDASFDTVVCNQVLEHTAHPQKVAHEIIRVLRSGGHAIITVPFTLGEHADPYDFFRYTTNGLVSLFKGAECVELLRTGGLFSILGSMWQFAFAHPYKQPGRWSRAISGYVQKICKFLDRWSPASDVLYAGVFLVVRKP